MIKDAEIVDLAQKLISYVSDGGPGSGNHHHKGRPGHVGGSGSGGQAQVVSKSKYGSPIGRRQMTKMSYVDIQADYVKAPGKVGKKPTKGYIYAKSHGHTMGPTYAQAAKQQRGMSIPKATDADAMKAMAYTKRHGIGTKALPYGTGVTRMTKWDLPYKQVSTLKQHAMMVDGNFALTPQRQQLHHQIINNLFEGANKPKNGQKKVFTMLGGGSAAGKSTISSGKFVDFPTSQDSPIVDPDALKAQLPQYVVQENRDKAAVYCHRESSLLSARALQSAWVNGYNVTLDGTGDGSVQRVMHKIESARHYGYQVAGVYVTCPTETAIKRSAQRAKYTNRVVPESVIRGTHAQVSYIWPRIATQFDHTELYDSDQGDGNPPKLIASCKRGQNIQIHDAQAYKRFLEKAYQVY